MSNPEPNNVVTGAQHSPREYRAVPLLDAASASQFLNEAFSEGFDGYPHFITIDGRSGVAILSREKKS